MRSLVSLFKPCGSPAYSTALAAVVALLGGCTPSAPRPAVHMVVGLDSSGSNRPHLAEDVRLAGRITSALDPDKDTVTFIRVDHVSETFFTGRPPDSSAAVQKLLGKELRPLAQAPVTRPVTFWQEADRQLQQHPLPSIVALLSDGEVDDQSLTSLQEARQTVEHLATAPNLQRVAVWGVQTGNRELLSRLLSPLGNRVTIGGFADADPAELFTLPVTSGAAEPKGGR